MADSESKNADPEAGVSAERSYLLWRQRKAAITRYIGSIERLMAEGDTAAVQDKLDKIKCTFDSLELVHNEITDTLSSESEFDKHEQWFATVESNYIDIVKKAKHWLELNTSHTGHSVKSESVESAPPLDKHVHNDVNNSALSDLVSLMNNGN